MILPVSPDPVPLSETEEGVLRVAGTRIPLDRIVRAFISGATPEQIVQDYDVLDIKDVYSVITWYLHHRDEVDSYLASAEQEAMKLKSDIEQQFDPTDIRARLLKRRRVEAG